VINRKYITTDFQRTVESTFEKFLLMENISHSHLYITKNCW